MSAEKFVEIQNQMRLNTSELKDYLADLDEWSSNVKTKEEKLKTEDGPAKSHDLPPVRNSLDKKVRKKKKSKKESAKDRQATTAEKKRIGAYDFRAWDQFDVDKACEDVESSEPKQQQSSSEYETDEEWEELRMKQQAILSKDHGNQYFKEGKYEEAIECYTRGINCDATNALLPANRAMALLKQDKFAAAELDCTLAISLDPSYIKAYQRRGTARIALKKLKEAKEDFQFVLRKEPNNKLALTELDKIEKIVNAPQFSVSTESEVGVVKPIHKPAHQRSKKPLKRVTIEVVGEDNEEAKSKKFAEKAPPPQSSAARKLASEDQEHFEKFTKKQPTGGDSAPVISSPADIGLCQTSSSVPETSPTATSITHYEVDETATSKSEVPPKPKDAQSVTSLKSPSVPTTSYQFQADYKRLKSTPENFFVYFKEIDPMCYPKLFGQFLDSDVLMRILRSLLDFYIPRNMDIIPVLKNLTAVKRFEMTVMFMTNGEKAVVKDLFQHLRSNIEVEQSELCRLEKLYNL